MPYSSFSSHLTVPNGGSASVFKGRVGGAVSHAANPLRRLSAVFTASHHRHSSLKVDDGVVPIGYANTSMTRQLAFGISDKEQRSKLLLKRWWAHQICIQVLAILFILLAVVIVAIFRMKEKQLDRRLCEKYFRKHYNTSCDDGIFNNRSDGDDDYH